MRIWLLYISVFVAGFSCVGLMINRATSPERMILGKWDELKWEYEIIGKDPAKGCDKYSKEMDEHVGKDLVLHRAETWVFLPNGKLQLKAGNKAETADWRIKGRGNILQIKYHNDTTENYNLSVLEKDKMILNFEQDMQARGIAKLTFKKS